MEENLNQTEPIFGVSDFVALVNQTFEYAYPLVAIRGELANFKVSKGKWVYFDLKDETAIVRFFGTIYQLSGPLEDGMMLLVRGAPRLHPRFGFSVTVQSIRPEGEGSLRRAAVLLQAKLTAEGLFDDARKRPIPYPPSTVGLITSKESAAYADFIKILNARWGGVRVLCADTQVQGEAAPEQIVRAIAWFNRAAAPPEVLVVIRGGGSAEDLIAFNNEAVVRAVAASRIPTLVAIGHEIDVSLAELAADRRASTPSNAAELLVPDRREVHSQLHHISLRMRDMMLGCINEQTVQLDHGRRSFQRALITAVDSAGQKLATYAQLLEALNPQNIIHRGYAIVRGPTGAIVRRVADVPAGSIVNIEVSDGRFDASVK